MLTCIKVTGYKLVVGLDLCACVVTLRKFILSFV
jgi:hypothetical protein